MRTGLLVTLLLVWQLAWSQEPPGTAEQQLESRASEEPDPSDESYLQDLDEFRRHPVDLNRATGEELQSLRLLSESQIRELVRYRALLGKLVDIHELQAVPGWDLTLIRNLLPFVTISAPASLPEDMRERLHKGEYQLLLRASEILERSAGYRDSGYFSHYQGSPLRLMLRCSYRFKNLLQYGYLGEKDAGEAFLKGAQRTGFDFNSWHFFLRRLGPMKALAIGDFTVNMGQGLIQWQGLGYGKSAQVINVKRQSPVLRPYQSAGEFGFYRGVGLLLARRSAELLLFASSRNLNANLRWDSATGKVWFSSLLESGFNRTAGEQADRNAVRQLSFGGSCRIQGQRGHWGLNGVQHVFSLPMQKAAEPYNLYAIRDDRWTNLSTDFSWSLGNAHWFGEAAIDSRRRLALISGLILSPDAKLDLSLLYRRMAPGYQSFSGDAFTENTRPGNEEGLYLGVNCRPVTGLDFSAYADLYRFRWLRFGTSAPSSGRDFMAQLTYSPMRNCQVYARFKQESKPANQAIYGNPLPLADPVRRSQWRVHLQQSLSQSLQLRFRVETVRMCRSGLPDTRGYLTYADLGLKLPFKPWHLNARLQYFETDGYDSRIYAFENDVPMASSIPSFYDRGFRYYLVYVYRLTVDFQVAAKFSQLWKPGREQIGSGTEAIQGDHRSELRIQASLRI